MRKSSIFLISIPSVIIVYYLFILFIAPAEFVYRSKISKGHEIILKIESYKKKFNRVPANLKEIGYDFSEEGPIFYQKRTQNSYIIWFGTTLGESGTYYSTTKKWIIR